MILKHAGKMSYKCCKNSHLVRKVTVKDRIGKVIKKGSSGTLNSVHKEVKT
jgi:hypothetical protein